MLYKGGSPLINPGVFTFYPEKVTYFGSHASNLGIYQEHPKDFFLEYQCKEKEIVPITQGINKKLSWGFDSEEITVETKEDKIIFKDNKDKYTPDLDIHEPELAPWEYTTNDIGLVPVYNYQNDPEWDKKTINLPSVFETDTKELKLPNASFYELIFSKDGLTTRIDGDFSRKLTGDVINGKEIKVKIDAIYFSHIIENLEGKIRIALNEDIVLFLKDKHTSCFSGTMLE